MTQEPYKPNVELAQGPLGTLAVAQGAERAVLLRTVRQSTGWKAATLDAWAASSTRAQALHHPSLLAVIDVSRTADALVIATEYVQGVPLSVLIARARAKHRAIPPELAERVVLDLARSVASTQELLAKQGDPRPLGWVHPESVLVTSGDDALIADVGLLGLDAIAEHADLLTFRAPELLDGRGVTPSSAVYSLGLLLWELLAGRNALGEGTTASSAAEVRRRALAGAIPRLDLVAPSAPALLVGIASQAIHRDPAERFPDVAAFVETLSVRKRPGPGALVRFMNELCGDLIEAQRGAVVRPQAAAASWRPTFHPGDEAPEVSIPRAPRAIGLAAFREPVAAPAVVIADKPEPEPKPTPAAEAPPIELPPAPPAHAPQATLPLILVKKVSTPPPAITAPIAAVEDDDEALPPVRSSRRGAFMVLVALIVAGAGALAYVAYQKQQQGEVAEPALTPPAPSPASASPSVAAPAESASAAPSASSAPPERESKAERRAREAREEREARDERRKRRDAGAAPSRDWGKVDEEEPANPKSDNPYADPPAPAPAPAPAASSKFGY
ncbi:MAG: protein kinase [Myxococcales bacterium]|nr:protein kinase [Myxococcales bacterium]